MALDNIIEPPAAESAGDPVPDPAPAPANQAPAAETAAAPEPDTFDRAYVENLRQEAAGYRTKYSPYRDVFESADEEVREYVLDLSRQLINSPLDSLEELESLVAQLKEAKGSLPGNEAPPAATPEANPVSESAKPMTRADWEKIREEERGVELRTQEIENLRNEVKELGYVDASEDEYGDLASLLAIATRYTDGDLAKAHAKRAERFESEVTARVEARIEAIRKGTEKWAPVSSAGTSPASATTPPKTIQEAGRAARAYIDKLYSDS